MIEVGALKVRSFVLDELTISWQAELDPDENIDNFEFRVLRSLSPEDEFESISPGLIDTYAFVDRDVNTRSKWRKFYYKVEASHIPTGFKVYSEVASSYIPSEITLLGLEIARQEQILLRGSGETEGFTGVPCILFIKRTFGPCCPECWDFIKKKVRRSRCPVCYGTGRYRGYMNPINPVYFQIEPHSQSEDHSNIGIQQNAQTSAWTSNYPLLSNGDIIIEPGNKRWRIGPVQSTEQFRVPVRQMVQLFYIDKSDIEYELRF